MKKIDFYDRIDLRIMKEYGCVLNIYNGRYKNIGYEKLVEIVNKRHKIISLVNNIIFKIIDNFLIDNNIKEIVVSDIIKKKNEIRSFNDILKYVNEKDIFAEEFMAHMFQWSATSSSYDFYKYYNAKMNKYINEQFYHDYES